MRAKAWMALAGASLLLFIVGCTGDGTPPSSGASRLAPHPFPRDHPSDLAGQGQPFESCEGVPTWDAYMADGKPAALNDRVQQDGSLFECSANADGVAWCKVPAYKPLAPEGFWKEAWVELGTCVEDIDGNRLTLAFPPNPSQAPSAAHAPIPTGPSDTPAITGILRCPDDRAHDRAFSADWGQSINIDKLSVCRYQLIVNAPHGSASTNTPAIVNFDAEPGLVKTFDVAFQRDVDLDRLALAPGMKIEFFARGIRQARQMALGKDVLYVGSSSIPDYAGGFQEQIASFIYALPLDSATKRPNGLYLLADHQTEPHGVAYRNGKLYFSTTGRLYRIDNVDSTLDRPSIVDVMKFPADDKEFPLRYSEDQKGLLQWHQKHPLFFNPLNPSDAKLYTAVGRPCNVCVVPDDRYGTLMSIDLDKGTFDRPPLAKGVRNSVGFDWNPKTGEVWFSDNNRQNIPNPDEINRIARSGQDFGAPYVFGRNTVGYTSDEYDGSSLLKPNAFLVKGARLGEFPPDEISPSRYTAPALELPSNSAPLGVKFIDEAFYPGAPKDGQRMLVAVHGPGSDKGVEVRMLTIVDDKVIQSQTFVGGWVGALGEATGRPVEFLRMPDDSMLLSDDVSGAIYRLHYDTSGLPATRVAIHLGNAPDPAVAAMLPEGTLTDEKGRVRRFQMAWGSPDLSFDRLPLGTYTLRMGTVGKFIPGTPTTIIGLTSTSLTKTVDVDYVDGSTVRTMVTFKAPARPTGEDVPANWSLTAVSSFDGSAKTIQVPWGASEKVELGYGVHALNYAYLPKHVPHPMSGKVDVQGTAPIDAPDPPAYGDVGSIGAYMLAASPDNPTCYNCHKGSFDGAEVAETWDKAGKAALVEKVKAMSPRLLGGHCDDTCSQAIADYMFTELWEKYLSPPLPRGTRQVRPLTATEYINSVKDVLGVAVERKYLPPDDPTRPFAYPGAAAERILSDDVVKKYYNEGMQIARKIDLHALGYTGPNDAGIFTRSIGRLLFRRPLSDAEAERYLAMFDAGDESIEGPRLAVAAMLASPHFLYHEELGKEVEGKPGLYRLTPYELAAALSFAVLGTTPDDALLTKAANGELETPEAIGKLVDQMTTSDRGAEHFLEFIRYYTTRDYPLQLKDGLDEKLIEAMNAERDLFVTGLIKEPGATVRELFDPPYTYLNEALAQHYGIPGVTGTDMRKVALSSADREQRGGLLHQGALLASKDASDATVTAMVRRGFTLREHVFCRQFGIAENDNVLGEWPDDRAITRREMWEYRNGAKSPSKTCNSCHRYTNGLGATMEHYDQTGRYRTIEKGANEGFTDVDVNIDSAGPIADNAEGVFTTVSTLRDLSDYIPTSNTAMRCLADSYYRFVYGEPSTYSYALVRSIADRLVEGEDPDANGNLHDMFRALATSEAFRYRVDRSETGTRASAHSPITQKELGP